MLDAFSDGLGLILWDEKGTGRAMLTVVDAGPAMAVLRDAEGKMIWHAP